MTRYVAFLRGINLGRRRIEMSRLREIVGQLDFTEVKTFIASGNVLFSTRSTNAARLEDRIATHLEGSLGYPVDTFVRKPSEIIPLGNASFFPEQDEDGHTLHVGFLRQPLPSKDTEILNRLDSETDAIRVSGREIFWLCRIPTHQSKLWSLPTVRRLQLPSITFRNVTSLRKLIEQHLTPS